MIVVCSPVDARLELICEWLVEHGYSPLPAATAAAAARLCRYTRPSPYCYLFGPIPAGSDATDTRRAQQERRAAGPRP